MQGGWLEGVFCALDSQEMDLKCIVFICNALENEIIQPLVF